MKISQEIFNAEIPKLTGHLLPDTFSKLAQNCNTEKGDLRSFRAPSKEEAISITTCKSVYLHTENTNTHWVTDASERHYCKSPVSGDTYERVYFSGEAELRFFANDNISGGGFDPAVDYYKLGIPAPTAAPTVATTGGGAVYKGYVYAFVNSYGDEGPPSPVGFDTDYNSGNIAIEDIESAPADRAIDTVRLYRTNSTATGTAEFQFVLDATWFSTAVQYEVGDFVIYLTDLYKCTTQHPVGAWNAGHFTAGDDVLDADLLSVFPKTNFDPPPSGLSNLISLANGSFAGFIGNKVYFSEPYYPHAYPTDYIISVDFAIVGMANDKNVVTVVGPGKPYVLYGNHPSTMSRIRGSDIMPCPNIRGIVSGSGGSFFVTRQGIIFSDGTKFTNITESLMTIDDLADYTFSSLALYWYDGKLFAFDSVGGKGFIIDFASQNKSLVRLSVYAHAATVADDGLFYIVADDTDLVDENDPPASMPLAVKHWEGATTDYLLFTYQSREFVYQKPTNCAAAYIVIDQDFYDAVEDLIDHETANAAIWAAGLTGYLGEDGPLGGGHDLAGDEMLTVESYSTSSNVIFKLYVDGELKFTKLLNGVRNRIRLPSGYLGDRMYYQISGYIPVKKVSIATSMDEI